MQDNNAKDDMTLIKDQLRAFVKQFIQRYEDGSERMQKEIADAKKANMAEQELLALIQKNTKTIDIANDRIEKLKAILPELDSANSPDEITNFANKIVPLTPKSLSTIKEQLQEFVQEFTAPPKLTAVARKNKEIIFDLYEVIMEYLKENKNRPHPEDLEKLQKFKEELGRLKESSDVGASLTKLCCQLNTFFIQLDQAMIKVDQKLYQKEAEASSSFLGAIGKALDKAENTFDKWTGRQSPEMRVISSLHNNLLKNDPDRYFRMALFSLLSEGIQNSKDDPTKKAEFTQLRSKVLLLSPREFYEAAKKIIVDAKQLEKLEVYYSNYQKGIEIHVAPLRAVDASSTTKTKPANSDEHRYAKPLSVNEKKWSPFSEPQKKKKRTAKIENEGEKAPVRYEASKAQKELDNISMEDAQKAYQKRGEEIRRLEREQKAAKQEQEQIERDRQEMEKQEQKRMEQERLERERQAKAKEKADRTEKAEKRAELKTIKREKRDVKRAGIQERKVGRQEQARLAQEKRDKVAQQRQAAAEKLAQQHARIEKISQEIKDIDERIPDLEKNIGFIEKGLSVNIEEEGLVSHVTVDSLEDVSKRLRLAEKRQQELLPENIARLKVERDQLEKNVRELELKPETAQLTDETKGFVARYRAATKDKKVEGTELQSDVVRSAVRRKGFLGILGLVDDFYDYIKDRFGLVLSPAKQTRENDMNQTLETYAAHTIKTEAAKEDLGQKTAQVARLEAAAKLPENFNLISKIGELRGIQRQLTEDAASMKQEIAELKVRKVDLTAELHGLEDAVRAATSVPPPRSK